MYKCLFFLLASYILCEITAKVEPIGRIIQDYFNSESVKRFRQEWDLHRKPIEHAILTVLKETVGLPGMNVYIKKVKEKLASGYLHTDNQIQLILSDLDLEDEPRCLLLSEVQLSLASNVLKIQTSLSKMIIHADYTLIRNRSDIIYERKDQDPLKSSPFLFEQVQDVGKVAITVEDCKLSGFIMTILNGESVNLGYDHFKFVNCTYSIEIYRPGENSPPVIAQYEMNKDHGLGLTHLLMKPLVTEELVPKLQAAMFSLVNTSALFGNALQEYRENQETVFQTTAQHFTEFIRDLNRITVEKNQGAIKMKDYVVRWDDGKIKPSKANGYIAGESMMLMDMVLTGLDTMYSAHCGGPFKIETVMMADEIRFSSLQVRGKLIVKSIWLATFSFAAEISDMVVDLQMGQSQGFKKDRAGFKKFEVKGLRRMSFTVPRLTLASAESLVIGYLMNEVPQLLKSHLSDIFSEAIRKDSNKKSPPVKGRDSAYSEKNSLEDDDFDDDDIYDSAEKKPKPESVPFTDPEDPLTDPEDPLTDPDDPLPDSEDRNYQDFKLKRERNVFKKNKKRFTSLNRTRRRLRRYGSRNRVADN